MQFFGEKTIKHIGSTGTILNIFHQLFKYIFLFMINYKNLANDFIGRSRFLRSSLMTDSPFSCCSNCTFAKFMNK